MPKNVLVRKASSLGGFGCYICVCVCVHEKVSRSREGEEGFFALLDLEVVLRVVSSVSVFTRPAISAAK